MRRGSADKPGFYASAGNGLYALFDPYRAAVRWMWEPRDGVYTRRGEVPYGGAVELPGPLGVLAVDTDELPVDPGGAGRR
ncbi:hypothetical protein [Nocardiopsis coralliicola]